MASEDSQDLGWLPVIHRLRNLRDLDDAFHREVSTELHQLDDPSELLVVLPFEVRSGFSLKNGTIRIRRSSNR